MKQDPTIIVIGSTNTDLVVKSARFPYAGETILGDSFFMNLGGKGANQAVTVARLGRPLLFVTKIGQDIFGKQAQRHFEEEGIDTSFVFTDRSAPSGVALITVDANAENRIIVASGANANLLPRDIDEARSVIEQTDIVLMQLEIPLQTVEYVAEIANSMGKKVILNPAPACRLSQKLLKNIFLITPNETEAEIISGIKITDIESAEKAAATIVGMGVSNVIITLGNKGAFIYTEADVELIPAHKVHAVDTTAAGDVFNGALAVALSEGRYLVDAVRFACAASSISVMRMGAQASIPYRNEVDNLINI